MIEDETIDGEPQGREVRSRLARLRLWLAGYYELETIVARKNDHLLRDTGLSRDAARDAPRRWWIIGHLLLLRRGGE